MNKNIFSKTVFFVLLVVVLSLFCFIFVVALDPDRPTPIRNPSVAPRIQPAVGSVGSPVSPPAVSAALSGGSNAVFAPTTTLPVYPMASVDSEDEACKAVAGSGGLIASSTNKCCGGNKLRSSDDPLCQAKSLCDGTTWHSANEPNEQLGEVFRIPASAGLENMQYPIVNINGGLVMCVDDLKYNSFRAERAIIDSGGDPIGCVPNEPNNNNGTSFGGQELDYLCPFKDNTPYYYAGGNMVPGAGNVCRVDHIVNQGGRLKSGAGYLFCNGWYDNDEDSDDLSGMWGHAYLLSDAGFALPFQDDNSPTSERCPSAIGGPWYGPDGLPFSDTTVIPCPGMVEVTNIPEGSYAGPFGSADSRIAGVCLPKQANEPVYDIFFNNLNYVRAKVVVSSTTGAPTNPLGKVNGKQYICDTTNRNVPLLPGQTNAKIHICCGRSIEGCSDIPGTLDLSIAIPYAAGQFILYNDSTPPHVNSNFKLFCRSDGTWNSDLDADNYACTYASNGVWTGASESTGACCSEGGDDSALYFQKRFSESFNSPGGKGVCLKGSSKLNGASIDFGRSIVSNGAIIGCTGDMWRTNDDGFSLRNSNVNVSGTSVPGSSSDSAYSPDSTKSLIVWNSATGVSGQFVSRDGSLAPLSTPQNIAISTSVANSVRVAYSTDDKKFLVVFGDSSGLQGKFIKEDGSILSSFPIISGACYLGGGDSFGSIAYSSGAKKFVVSCTKGSPTSGDVVVAIVNSDGSLHSSPVSVGIGSRSSVSVSDSQALVTWSSADTKFLRMVSLSTPSNLSLVKSISGAGWIYSAYNSVTGKFDLAYGSIDTLFKRSLSSDNNFVAAEVKIPLLVNVSVIDATSISNKNSIFLLFPSDNFVGGLSIVELSSNNVLSKPFDVANVSFLSSKLPVMNTNSSISNFNGIPMTLMVRQNSLYMQSGGLAPLASLDWSNPGSTATNKVKGSLVSYSDICTRVETSSGEKFCDVDGSLTTISSDKSHFSFVPAELMNYFKTINPNVVKNLQCCAPNQCFDPVKNTCINPQLAANEYYNLSNGNVYKCINGVWGSPIGGYKFTPDVCKRGFCNAPGQCLYNPTGSVLQNGNTSGNPQCINSGQFIGDALCLNGSWSSRTVLATNTLLKFTKNPDGSIKNYVLVCSNSSMDVLVNAQSPGNFKNAYCILDLLPGTTNNQRIIAVALAQDLEIPIDAPGFGTDYMFAIKKSFLMSYPLAKFNSTCTIVDGYRDACAIGKKDDLSLLKLYYNSTSKIVVFSDKEIVNLRPTWQETVCGWLPNWLGWLCPSPQAQTSSFTNLTFDRIYSSKVGNTEVLGISKNRCEAVGTTKVQSYIFNYKGYSVGDVQNVIGTSDLYTASEFLITPGVDATSSKVSIKNPSGIDRTALWNALSSVRK